MFEIDSGFLFFSPLYFICCAKIFFFKNATNKLFQVHRQFYSMYMLQKSNNGYNFHETIKCYIVNVCFKKIFFKL